MKPVPGFPGYHADDAGRILSTRCGRPMVLSARMHRGYLHVQVRHGIGRATKVKVPAHQLVCLAYHGEKPTPDHVASFKDGDPKNTSPTNIEWRTRSGVVMGQVQRGTASCLRTGELHNRHVLSDAQVADIRRRVNDNRETQTAVARGYGVSQRHVSAISRGTSRSPTPGGPSISGA